MCMLDLPFFATPRSRRRGFSPSLPHSLHPISSIAAPNFIFIVARLFSARNGPNGRDLYSALQKSILD